MNRGWLLALRTGRRGIARALAAALLFPVLVALLPPLSVSAAEALERDLAQSICGQTMPEQGGGMAQHTGHDHCILAGTACPACAPTNTAAAPAFAAAPIRIASVPAYGRDVSPPVRPVLLLTASPPRGPPASLPI